MPKALKFSSIKTGHLMEVKKSVNMTFDELSMERSKSFIKALQELKNLRPQLHSAAEYCENSYLHNDQKQMVLENLKDYAVRALVNTVDHLGTVASKLTQVIEQQTLEVSNMEMKVSCVNQRLLCCHTFTCYEVLGQHQLQTSCPKLHKRYALPNSAYKKVHFSPHVQTDSRQVQFARSQLQPSARSLSSHLTADPKSTLKCPSQSSTTTSRDSASAKPYPVADPIDSMARRSHGFSLSSLQPAGVPIREVRDQPLSTIRTAGSPKRETTPNRSRSKKVLSSFFVKPKSPKLNAYAAS